MFPVARGGYIDGEKSGTGSGSRRSVRRVSRKIMGTSVQMIDQTYGHLLPDSEEYLRGLLDTYDAAAASAD